MSNLFYNALRVNVNYNVNTTTGNFQTLTVTPSVSSDYEIKFSGSGGISVTNIVVKRLDGTVLTQFDFGLSTASNIAAGYVGVETPSVATLPYPSGAVTVDCGTSNLDTDNDGVPNYRDTDSDNDGCPDALEGTASYTKNDLDDDLRLGGGVDASGLPLITAGTPQGVGTSTDNSVKDVQCDTCNAANTSFVDSDGDGVGNDCDLDKDNDGILDTTECYTTNMAFTPTSNTQGTATANGNTITLNLTTTNGGFGAPQGSKFTFYETTPATIPATYTYTFNQAVQGVKLYISSINWIDKNQKTVVGNVVIKRADNTTQSNVDFNITKPENNPIKLDYTLSGNTYHALQGSFLGGGIRAGALLEFPSLTNLLSNGIVSISFQLLQNNSGNGLLAFGYPIVDVICDTDTDGIPNYLDLDSDNDGCVDALEGGDLVTPSMLVASAGTVSTGSAAANQNLCATNSCVDSQGVPTVVNAGGAAEDITAEQGQPVGSSQNNAIKSTYCQQCPTGYEPSPSSSNKVTNGNFAVTGGATGGGITSTPYQDPATTSGTNNTTSSIWSQARHITDGTYADSPNYNIYSLMSGTKPANTFFTGSLLNDFPGDPANNVAASTTYFYSNGNSFYGDEYTIWGQTVSGLVVGRSYTFYAYVNNAIESINATDDPIVRLRVGGNAGLPNGTLAAGPITLTEAATASTQPLGGWVRIAYNFTATATSQVFKVTSSAAGVDGDDFQMTQVAVVECRPTLYLSSNSPVCLGGGTLQLTASTSASGSMTYSWTGPNGFTSSLQNPMISPYNAVNAGTYTCIMTDSTGITNTQTIIVASIGGDSDGDGYGDTCDLDDDNDGIIDINEECYQFRANNLNGTWKGDTVSTLTVTTNTDANVDITNNFWNDGQVKFLSGTATTSDPTLSKYGYNINLTYTFSTPVKASEIALAITDVDSFGATQIQNTKWQLTVYDASNNVVTPGNYLRIDNSMNWGYPTMKANLSTGEILPFDFTSDDQALMLKGYGTNLVSKITLTSVGIIGDYVNYSLYAYKTCDTDVDGIPNYLDLDSDNDGCVDAIEGGADILSSQLVTAGGTVTVGPSSTASNQNLCAVSSCVSSTGIPQFTTLPTGYSNTTGQTEGSAYDNTINGCVCYNTVTNNAAGIDTKHGITLLQRAGADLNNWPMVRKSAHTVLESNTKGFVITRMTTAQINALVGVDGMLVYDTNLKCLKIYDGAQWSCFNKQACP